MSKSNKRKLTDPADTKLISAVTTLSNASASV